MSSRLASATTLACLWTAALVAAPGASAYNSTWTDGSWTYYAAYDTDFTRESSTYGSGGSCCVADVYMTKILPFNAPNTTNDYAEYWILLSSGPWTCYSNDRLKLLVNSAVRGSTPFCDTGWSWVVFYGSDWYLQSGTNSFTITVNSGNLLAGVDTDNDFGRSFNSHAYTSDIPGEYVAYFVHGYDASQHPPPPPEGGGGGGCPTKVLRIPIGDPAHLAGPAIPPTPLLAGQATGTGSLVQAQGCGL